MTFTTLPRMFTVTASTKRPPEFTGTKRGEAITNLYSLKCAPLRPISKQLSERASTNTPYVMLETCCVDTADVQMGDYLIVDGRDYPVKFVERWTGFLTIALEDLRNKKPV